MKTDFFKIFGGMLIALLGAFFAYAKDKGVIFERLENQKEMVVEMRRDQKEIRDALNRMAPKVEFIYNRLNSERRTSRRGNDAQ